MRLMDMDYMIWPVMSGNGVRIGMAVIIIVVHQQRTHQGRAQAHPGCCGVVIGTAIRTACG